MKYDRRKITGAIAGLILVPLFGCRLKSTDEKSETKMYGLIGKMSAVDGKREALSVILLNGLRGMPGNLSYIVANDPTNANDLWITEVWVDKAAHENSLTLPSVQEAISLGRPLIAGMDRIAQTQPIGGQGL